MPLHGIGADRARRREDRAGARRGAMSLQLLVILVPVLFGLMGFAVDLGRLYMIRSELQQAAQAMALASAGELAGTAASLENASEAAQLTINDTGNKYNFGSIAIGSSTGLLSSSTEEPAYFESASAALDAGGTGLNADGSTARFVRINLTADAPLLFWGLLTLGTSRRTPIAAQAVAGVSSPLCQACGIEPFAIAPLGGAEDDAEHFGFVPGTRYTLGYQCTVQPIPGGQAPPGLSGTTRVPYILLNRYNENLEIEEQQQAFRVGAQGMLPSTDAAQACVRVTAEQPTETIWLTAMPQLCSTQNVTQTVRAATCGLYTRWDSASHAACQTIPDVDGLTALYQPDSDIADIDDYAGSYAGNQRRVITVPIVRTLTTTVEAPMEVLGFRQFLLLPEQGGVSHSPGDVNARFPVLYIGSAVPVRQGRIDGCTQSYGPGKVVLHQ
jgi:Flp pilus assembly protein TadG